MFSKLIRTLVILGGGAGRLGGGFSPPPNDLITNVSKFSRHLLVCHVVQSDYMWSSTFPNNNLLASQIGQRKVVHAFYFIRKLGKKKLIICVASSALSLKKCAGNMPHIDFVFRKVRKMNLKLLNNSKESVSHAFF